MRLLAQKENHGFALGNNLAIKAASAVSEWIALLNPDAFVEPRWLEILLSAVHNYPGYAVFGSKLVNAAGPSVLDCAGDAYHMSGLVWRMGHCAAVSSVAAQVREVFSPCSAYRPARRICSRFPTAPTGCQALLSLH